MEEQKEEKKTYLNVYISPTTKELLEKHAKAEDRTLSSLTDRVLKWTCKWLEKAGDSQTLMSWEASGPSRHPISIVPTKRISAELQGQMHDALNLIFERAPSALVERVAEYLTVRAGKFGEEK